MNPLADQDLQQTLTGVFRLVLPEAALVATTCVVFLVACYRRSRDLSFALSLAGVVVAGLLAVLVKPVPPALASVAPVMTDAAAAFVQWLALITAGVLLFIACGEVEDANAAEYTGCLLAAAAGVSLVAKANDLVPLFLALELLSIPTYVLLYLPVRTRLNQEAAAKYFLLSVMSSAVLLFGFSYLYGLTGSTNLTVITDTLTKANSTALSPMALVGMALVIAGMAFRVTAVPFHFYAPDVYEGGPPGVIAQLAFLPKVAGFLVLARLLGLLGADPRHLPFEADSHIPLLLYVVALLTMTLGNVLALLQDNVRRMLAYSGVAHAGYMLIGVLVACSLPDAKGEPVTDTRTGATVGLSPPTVGGIDALLVYLVAYGLMTVGAFAVLLYLSTPERPVEAIDDLAGLAQTHPVSAAALAVFLFSLIGLPLTAGFVGKFLLFVGAFTAPTDSVMQDRYRILAVVAAVNAAVGAYYYLRVVAVMYLRTPLRPLTGSRSYPTLGASLALAAATLVLGVYPEPLVKAARAAAPVPPPVTLAGKSG